MMTVFLDTVGLIALWEQTDQWHAAAEHVLVALATSQTRLVTTSFILLECGNAAARKPYRADVDALRSQLAAAGNLIHPTEFEMEQAWQDYRAGAAGDAGIVDHVSFIVMRRLAITDAFTNDRHFRMAGFRTLF